MAEVQELKYEMRKIKSTDLFKMSKVLKKMQLKVDTAGKTQQQLGAELVLSVVENLGEAEQEVAELLGSLVGLSADQFLELELEDTLDIVTQFKKQDGIKRFLSLVMQ